MAAKTETPSLPETADSDCIPMFEDSNLPEGWSRKVAQRLTGKSAGTFDVYLFSPDGRKLRSKSQLEDYLKETNSDLKASEFDFTVRGRNSVATPSASASASAKPTTTKPKPKPKKIPTTPRPRVTLKRVSDQPRHSPATAAKKSVSEPVGRTRSSTSSSASSSKSFGLPSQRRQPRTRKAGNRTMAKRRIATSSVPKKTKGRDDDDEEDEDDDQESDDEPKKTANDADKVTRAGKRKKQTPPSAQKSKLRSRTSYATTANVDPDSENTNDDSDSNNVAAGSESGTSMLNLSLTINGKSLWTWEWRINQALYKQLKRGGRLEKRMRKRVQKQGKDSRGTKSQ